MSVRIHVPDEWADVIKMYKEAGIEIPLPDAEAVDVGTLLSSDRKLANKASENQVLKKKVAKLEKDLSDSFARQEFLDSIKGDKGTLTIRPTSKHLSESVVFAIASDWHAEENIDPKTIAGVYNKYNPDIFKSRANRFFSKITYLTEMVRVKTKVDTMVLALLGDMINGYIHEEMVEDNFMSPTEACVLVKKVVKAGIDYLLANAGIKNLIIPCCWGNHGRTTQKRRIATGAANSFEWLMYKDLEDHYEKDKRVTFHVADGYHNYLDVYGYTIRFHHGDSLQYGGGVGGITVPVNKAIAKWNTIKPAYLDVFGHFHQFIDGGNFICNGSLCGYNSFALSIKAAYERPQQAFFVIDKKHGKTVVCPIIVEDPK